MPLVESYRGCQRKRKRKPNCEDMQSMYWTCATDHDADITTVPKLRWSRKHEKFHPHDGHIGVTRSDCVIKKRPEKQGHRSRGHCSGTNGQEPSGQKQPRHRGHSMQSIPDALSASVSSLTSTSVEDTGISERAIEWSASQSGAEYLSSQNKWTSTPGPMQIDDIDHFRDPFSWGIDKYFSDAEMQILQGSGENAYYGNFLGTPSIDCEEAASLTALSSTPVITSNSVEQASGAEQRDKPAKPKSLLGAFYRLQSPTSIARFSDEHLVRHYFNNVCALFSCYDSDMNPFRTFVANVWTTSCTIHLTIQSMAIAHLSNHYRYMAPLGRRKLAMAWKSFQLDLQMYRRNRKSFEEIMLALLLLGLSASWHSPKVLEPQFLLIARNIMQVYLQDPMGEAHEVNHENEKFFVDAVLHWELLASFVEITPMVCFPGFGSPLPALPDEKKARLPHPWTGAITELHYVLAEVGRVLRRVKQQSSGPCHSKTTAQLSDDEIWVASLEQFLYSLQVPGPEAILEYNDGNTPKTDLVRMAEAQRLFGLLEIYNAFPKLMANRLVLRDSFIAALGLQKLDSVCYGSMIDEDSPEAWQCLIAVYALKLVEEVPITSGACRLQPLVLTSCASYLNLPDESEASDVAFQAHLETVYEARYFVEARLLALSRKYPQRPILRLLDVVKEQWQRSTEDSDTRWLQIALEKGFEMVG